MPRSARLAVAVLTSALLLEAPATAAPSTTPEPSFVTNGSVQKIIRTPSRTFIGGDFSYVGPRTGFGAVIGSNGAFEPTYPEVNGKVNTSVADGSGGWFIGGEFTRVGGVERDGLAHILANGTLDPSFNPDITYSVNQGRMKTISRAGSDLYVSGTFTHIGGVARANVARLDLATGNLETDWAPTVGGIEVILAANNRVYLGGTFSQVNSTARLRLAAVNQTTGALDTSFVANVDSEETLKNVKALHLRSSKLYLAGSFGTVNGTARAGVAAVSATTGALDTAFAPTSLFDFQQYTSLTSNNTQLFVAGDRSQVQSFDLATGARDPDFQALIGGDGFGPEATTVAMGFSTLLVGGFFTKVNGVPRQRFAALDPNTGAVSNSVVQTLSHTPRTITPPDSQSLGRSFVGGDFTSVGGIERRSVAALDADGNVDPAFEQNSLLDGFSGGEPALIDAMALGDGRLYVGGEIREVGGEDKFGVFALDTKTGDFVPGFNGEIEGGSLGINDLELRDGRLYVAGAFHRIGGAERRNLAALDPATGAPLPGFVANATHQPSDFDDVVAMAFHGRRMYVTGRFNSIGGVARDWVAALDATTGAVDPDFDLDLETNQTQPMRSLATDGDRVYMSGTFTSINGFPRSNIAAVTAGGGDVVVGWNATLNSVADDIAIAGDRIFLAGFFNTINGVPRRGFGAVARANGATDPWDMQGGGLFDGSFTDQSIGETVSVAHGRVDIGGGFARLNGRAHSGLASVAIPMPVNSAAPAVSGVRRAGQVLSCSPGTWSNGPTFSFEWLRDGARIPGATGSAYTVAAGDAGKRIACLVTASNADGSAELPSAAAVIERPSTPVKPGPRTSPPAGGTQPGGSPPPTGDPGLPRETPAAARIARGAVRLRRGAITVRLTCPAGGGSCSGRLVLSTAERRSKRLGAVRFRIAAGGRTSVKVRVARKLRKRAARLRKVRAVAGPARATLRLRR